MENAIVTIFVLVILEFQIIMSQKTFNPECRNRPKSIPVTAADCCPMPDLFPWESMGSCGVEEPSAVSFPSLRGSPDCEQRKCLFRNHDLLFDNDDVDYDSVKQYLDEWAEKRKQYINSVIAAKETCLSGKRLFALPSMCVIDSILFCINAAFLQNCPHFKPTEACSMLKAFWEDCLPYFE